MQYGLQSIAILLLPLFLYAQNWVSYDTSDGLASNQVNSVYVDGLGVKWFGTDKGISVFYGSSTWATFLADQTLVSDNIHDFALEFDEQDRSLSMWVATDSGLVKIGLPVWEENIFFTPFTVSNSGLVSNKVFTTAIDSLNIKWFGTENGLASLSGSDWLTYDQHLANSYIISIGAHGAWKYVGTMGGGVSRVFNNGVDAVTSASPYDTDWSGLLSDNVYDICVTENGDQWYATDVGAAHHQGTLTKSGWTNYIHGDILPENNVLPDNHVRAIAEDKSGNIWLGTQNGVAVFDSVNWTIFTTEDGLASNNVSGIAVDLDNSIWFATDNGVTHLVSNPLFVRSSQTKISGFSLEQNYPNPFNPATVFRYELKQNAHVQLGIFNIRGQKVRTLINTNQFAGAHSAWWDGRDYTGNAVVSGVYVYRLSVHTENALFAESKKMLLIK